MKCPVCGEPTENDGGCWYCAEVVVGEIPKVVRVDVSPTSKKTERTKGYWEKWQPCGKGIIRRYPG